MPTVRELREAFPLTQAELAALAMRKNGDGVRRPVHEATVLGIELGRVRPRPSTKRALAKALGVSPRDIAWPDGTALAS